MTSRAILLARPARQWRAAARIAFGGLRVDDAIVDVLLRVVEPGAIAAAAEAEAQAASRRDQVREALARNLEAARYGADRVFRQYDNQPVPFISRAKRGALAGFRGPPLF